MSQFWDPKQFLWEKLDRDVRFRAPIRIKWQFFVNANRDYLMEIPANQWFPCKHQIPLVQYWVGYYVSTDTTCSVNFTLLIVHCVSYNCIMQSHRALWKYSVMLCSVTNYFLCIVPPPHNPQPMSDQTKLACLLHFFLLSPWQQKLQFHKEATERKVQNLSSRWLAPHLGVLCQRDELLLRIVF